MALIRLLILAALMGGEVYEGFAPHYAQGVMERVAARRDIAPAACMVSSARYAVGTWLYVYGPNTQTLRYCRVTDVSGPKDRARHLRTRRVVELSYEVTEALCGTTKGRVVDCPVIVIRLNE